MFRDGVKAPRRAESEVAEKPNHSLPADEITNPSKDGAEAGQMTHEKASCKLPPQPITDAAQAAGQATSDVPSQAGTRLPDHQLPDAPQGAGETVFYVTPTSNGSMSPRQFCIEEVHTFSEQDIDRLFGSDAGARPDGFINTVTTTQGVAA